MDCHIHIMIHTNDETNNHTSSSTGTIHFVRSFPKKNISTPMATTAFCSLLLAPDRVGRGCGDLRLDPTLVGAALDLEGTAVTPLLVP